MAADETRIRPPNAPAPSAPPEVASLVCVAGDPDALGLRIALDRELVLGRDPAAAVPLRSPDASRRHARVVPEGEGHLVEDLGSTNGTFVNGEEVERRPLRSGDRIDVGGAVFKYLARGDAEAAEWERLRAEAVRDALTGLPNRRAFDDALAREVARAEREGAPLAALLLDVDRFKTVNDAHGHAAGDAVLRAVAARARGALRAADLLARVGGEELAALLPGADAAAAREAGERIRRAVKDGPIEAGGAAIPVTLSVGVAVRRAGEDGPALLARADARLYAAKREGRDRVAD
jgi:two-component system, cell cycle response regulator